VEKAVLVLPHQNVVDYGKKLKKLLVVYVH
jgi:hypothetical protein